MKLAEIWPIFLKNMKIDRLIDQNKPNWRKFRLRPSQVARLLAFRRDSPSPPVEVGQRPLGGGGFWGGTLAAEEGFSKALGRKASADMRVARGYRVRPGNPCASSSEGRRKFPTPLPS